MISYNFPNGTPFWRQEEKGDVSHFRSFVKDWSPSSLPHSITYPDFWEEANQRHAELDVDIDFSPYDEEDIA